MNNEIKLVKQIGIKEATKLIDEAERFRMHLVGDDWDKPSLIFRDDLKQIVDAWELVESKGGLRLAHAFMQSEKFKSYSREYQDGFEIAVSLVEQCQ